MTAQETAPPPTPRLEGRNRLGLMTISDLVSSSTELSGRLSALQRNLELGFDLPGFEEKLAETEEKLKALSDRFKEMKTDGRLGYERLSALKAEIVASAERTGKDLETFRGPGQTG